MKKIMFNDEYGLTNAVLQGRKTMTRRIMDMTLHHIKNECGEMIEISPEDMMIRMGSIAYFKLNGNWYIVPKVNQPRYKIDEVVAIGQSFKDLGYTKEWVEQHISPNPNAKPTDPFEKKYPGWNNKMFVPAELNNAHKIRITNIKCERLQDISDIDCAKEGVRYFLDYSQERIARFYIDLIPNYRPGEMITYDCAKDAFASLIDAVSGKGTWKRNLWVFVYSFELVK